MFGQNNFHAVQEQWKQFWEGKNPRPLIAAFVPKSGCEPSPMPGWIEGFTDDYRAAAQKVARWAQTHECVGEAIAYYPLSFGADHFAALLGLVVC